MRLLLFLIILPILASAQNVHVLHLETNDLLYNPNDQRIYASTPSTAGIYGNSICIIDPITAQIDTCVFIGSEPGKIVLTESGTKIFAALNGSAAVREFNLLYNTPGQQFALGMDSWSGPYYAEDLEVLKGSDQSVIVSRMNKNTSPKHEGVAVYDYGIMRSNTTDDHTGSNVIEVISNNRIVGFNNESTERGLRIMSVDANGVEELAVYKNLISGFNNDIYYSNFRLFSTNGIVLDLSTDSPFLLATLNDANGPVVEDTAENVVCYAFQEFWDDDVLLKKYSLNTFTLADTIAINEPVTTGEVLGIINWGGKDRYAYNTDEGKVVIIGSHLVSLDESAKISFSTYPNPAEDIITISSINDTYNAEIALISTSGEVLKREGISAFPYSFDISSYPAGAYFLKLYTPDQSSFYKIFKR